jgi:hypothetical protein
VNAIAPLLLPVRTLSAGRAHPPRAAAAPRRGLSLPEPPITRTAERHTTLTWVERNFGYAVARAYAGHNDRGNSGGTTTTYVRADVEEIAAALTALTGEPHPLTSPACTDEQVHGRG